MDDNGRKSIYKNEHGDLDLLKIIIRLAKYRDGLRYLAQEGHSLTPDSGVIIGGLLNDLDHIVCELIDNGELPWCDVSTGI